MNIKHIILLFGSLIFIMLACTPKVRYSVLSTIFDGVPPPYDERYELTVGRDTLGQQDSARTAAIMRAVREVKYNIHEPYREKKCASCHEQSHLGRLTATEPQLCNQCHESRAEVYVYNHGPYKAGYCTSCHSPHMSKFEDLLFNKGKEFCFGCHEQKDVNENKIHRETNINNCTKCHNPHGSNNRFMMKDGTCFTCHDDFTKDYSFLHGPVEAGFCSSCHVAHKSGKEQLLEFTGDALCYSCHDEDVIMGGSHEEGADSDCMNCHDPHGGENEFLLN